MTIEEWVFAFSTLGAICALVAVLDKRIRDLDAKITVTLISLYVYIDDNLIQIETKNLPYIAAMSLVGGLTGPVCLYISITLFNLFLDGIQTKNWLTLEIFDLFPGQELMTIGAILGIGLIILSIGSTLLFIYGILRIVALWLLGALSNPKLWPYTYLVAVIGVLAAFGKASTDWAKAYLS